MKAGLFALAGAIAFAAIILAVLTRYSDKAAPQGHLFVTDLWTGSVRICNGSGCRNLPNQ